MQSTAKVIIGNSQLLISRHHQKQSPALQGSCGLCWAANAEYLSFGFVFQHLAATVHTIGADVVAQVSSPVVALNSSARSGQCIVRTVHTAFGRGFFVLLNSHGGSWVLRGWWTTRAAH